ncbi:MAG: lipopolysaccharide biosynthesis protein [Alloprevotella sp.]|nr:lipopolysaccharide biosynthesis protein [Alloprevotella sp.]MBR1652934.1 lipopolysaccharide biosynthesis protein [Alloprevotella sp.]
MESLKEKTAKGLLWGGIANGLQQVLNLVFGIVIAQKLLPEDYGLVGMLTIFSAVAGALQEGGFISALNNRKDVTHEDYNSVFWFNLLVSVSIYATLFLCAPLIARFFGEPELTPLARYLFLGFVITSLNIAPRAYLFRNLKVKENSLIILFALFLSGIVGILMAVCKKAYWGLATQTIVYVSTITLLTYWVTGWRPSLRFTFRPVREMFGFSSKLILTNLCNIVNQNLFTVILARFYTKVEVGNFSQANKWNYMGHVTLTNMLWGVAQPVFSKVDDDPMRQLAVFRKLLRFTALLAFPAMFGLSLISREFILVTIGEKWIGAAAIMQMLCVWGAFVPIQSNFSNLLIARGKSNAYMWCTVALVVCVFLAAIGMKPWGMTWMLRVFVAVNIGWLFVWHALVHRTIGLRLLDMLRDIVPYMLLAASLCLLAAYLLQGIGNPWLSLVAKVIGVGATYCTILWLSGSVIFREAVDFLLRRKKKQ